MKKTRTFGDIAAWVLVAGLLILTGKIFSNAGWRGATTPNVEVAISSMGP